MDREEELAPPLKTREDYKKDLRVPLFAYHLVQSSGKGEITDKNLFIDNIRTWILTWEQAILDPNQLTYRYLQIYNSLKESVINTLPRHLLALDDWNSLVTWVYALAYNPASDVNAIKYFFLFLKSLYNNISTDWDKSKLITGWIDDSQLQHSTTPEIAQQKAREKMEQLRRKNEENLNRERQTNPDLLKKQAEEQRRKSQEEETRREHEKLQEQFTIGEPKDIF